MSKQDKRLSLFVATAFGGKGSESNAGWVRKNGDPRNLHTGSKRLKSIGKKQAELVAQILSVNAALRDMQAGSKVDVHIENQMIVDALNGESITPLLVKARRSDAKHLAKAAHGLADEIARHGVDSVRGLFIAASNDNGFDSDDNELGDDPQRYLSIAYQKANAVKKDVKSHGSRDRNAGSRGLNHRDGPA